jgi:tRNA pseudouridine32 synthase/23S rRNA pseudouridine746 synthase
MGWPIVGDPIYGSAQRTGGPGLQLQSHEIVVPISKNKDPVRVTAPVPPHMRELLAKCGWREEAAQAAIS